MKLRLIVACFVGLCCGGVSASAQQVNLEKLEAYMTMVGTRMAFTTVWAENCRDIETLQIVVSHKTDYMLALIVVNQLAMTEPLQEYLSAMINSERDRIGGMRCDREALRGWAEKLERSHSDFMNFINGGLQ